MTAEQLALDLFPVAKPRDPEAECLRWLERCHGCNADRIRSTVHRLFATFGASEGQERAKAITALDGTHKAPGLTIADADALGIFDPSLDYHEVWDRAWEAKGGAILSPDKCPHVRSTVYISGGKAKCGAYGTWTNCVALGRCTLFETPPDATTGRISGV